MTDDELSSLLAKLTPKQYAFVVEYAKLDFAYGKAAEALRNTGQADDHTNPLSVHIATHRMLTNDTVKAAIASLSRSRLPSPEQIIRRRAQIAYSDIADVLDDNGKIDVGKAIANGNTHVIRSVKQRPTKAGMEVSIELHDPQPSLKALEAVHGLDKQRIEVDAGDKLAALLAGMVAPWAKPAAEPGAEPGAEGE